MKVFGSRRHLFPGAVVLSLLLTATPAQSDSLITTTKTASDGKVRAELSYQAPAFPNPLAEFYFYQPRLKINRDGRTLLDEALPTRGKEAKLVGIEGPEVRDLDGDGEPEILLNIEYSRSTLIYRYKPSPAGYVLEQRRPDEKLTISNKLETRRVVNANNLQAELSFTEDVFVEGEVQLKLNRNGKTTTHRVALMEDEEIGTVDGPMIINLDGEGEPEVVLNVFSRFSYCCAYTVIYYYVPAKNTHARLKHGWGPYRNAGQLVFLDKDRVPEFISTNESFGDEFGPYALGKIRPLQIWRYRQGRLQDVTKLYPELIRKDAKAWWGEYAKAKKRKACQSVQMVLAAYLADMHMLGEGPRGWKQVRQVYSAKDRQAFFRNLRQALKMHGYAK